jgi:hypothetical protein
MGISSVWISVVVVLVCAGGLVGLRRRVMVSQQTAVPDRDLVICC